MSKFLIYEGGAGFRECAVWEAFPFLQEKKKVISLTGAGGKTTLMFCMAEYCLRSGLKTFVSTTTHIMDPGGELYVETAEEMKKQFTENKIAVAGIREISGKLSALSQDKRHKFMEYADITLLEADGARKMPLKIPRSGEPVIDIYTTNVVAVAGLDALGRRWSEACFHEEGRKDLFSRTGIFRETERICEEDFSEILVSAAGGRKGAEGKEYCIVLNKCDNMLLEKSAENIAEALWKNGERHIIAASFSGKEQK